MKRVAGKINKKLIIILSVIVLLPITYFLLQEYSEHFKYLFPFGNYLGSHLPWQSYQANNFSFQYPLNWSVKNHYGGSWYKDSYQIYDPWFTYKEYDPKSHTTATLPSYRILIDIINGRERKIKDQFVTPAEYVKYLCDTYNNNWYPKFKNLIKTKSRGNNTFQTQCSIVDSTYYLYNDRTLLLIDTFTINSRTALTDRFISSIILNTF